MIFRVGIENNNDGRSIAWALDHPGCFAYGQDGEQAQKNFPQAARESAAWIADHGKSWLDNDVEVLVEETFDAYLINEALERVEEGSDAYMVESFFVRDWKPLVPYEVECALNLLFTFELARRLENTGVTVNAVHSGLVRSSLMNEASAPMRFLLRLASAPAERVAVDILRVALDPEFEKVTGRFFHKAKEIEAAAYAHDRTAQQRLWEISNNLTGIAENKVDIPPDLTM